MPSISNPYQGAAASTRASTALAASQDANDLNRAAQLRAEQLRAARERMRRRGVLGEIAARSANERLSSNGLSSSGVTSMLERFASLRARVQAKEAKARGSTSDLPGAFWDLFPTLVELAGAPVPEGLDGLSLAPTLLGTGEQQHCTQV